MVCLKKRIRLYYGMFIICLIFQAILIVFLKRLNKDIDSKPSKIAELYKNLSARLKVESIFDRSKMYKIFYLNPPVINVSTFDLTLVSHCTSNHLILIDSLAKFWKGPISVAVFTDVDNVESTLWHISRIIHCITYIDLRLQLVIPHLSRHKEDYEYRFQSLDKLFKLNSCHLPYSINHMKNYERTTPYPSNLLRNVAKSGCSTEYILIIDIDMIPSFNLREFFLNFATSKILMESNAVYVAPVFEMKEDTKIPMNKHELIDQIREKNVRPFYHVPCQKCQKYSRYNHWLMANNNLGAELLYQVEWRHPWEPFFIAKMSIPDFDERFKQYGMNRVSQICELHVAGYKFYVLDNVFIIHRGFKTDDAFHKTKDIEMEENRQLYARFKEELKLKYPNSKGKC